MRTRKENIRRIAEVAKLFLNCGVITICCFVSPTNEIRELGKNVLSALKTFAKYLSIRR